MSRAERFARLFGAPGDPERPRRIVLAAFLTALLLIVPPVFVVVTTPATGGPGSFETATLEGTNGSVQMLNDGFLGVNVRADSPLSSVAMAALNATGVRVLRWPGGELADRFAPLALGGAGAIYNDSGVATPAATSLAGFVDGCIEIGCRAVITVPSEIDNASMAAAIVSYTERTLHFRPADWEIGNEPALWKHFAVPWSEWNVSQNLTPTPEEYATLVGAYAHAIRSVDPATPIVGIGGIGKGASEVGTWFDPVLDGYGPQLGGMAIHVYPAGPGYPLNDLAGWYGSLRGVTGLPARVAAATDAIDAACPGCPIPLLVDEFQTGTNLTPATALSGGYLAAFVAAEIVEGLPLPITTLDYFDLQGTTPGAWLDPLGAPSSSLVLFEAVHELLGTEAAGLVVNSSAPGLFAAEGMNATGGSVSLLLVNANPDAAYRVNLSAPFPDVGLATAWSFNGSASSPTTGSIYAGSPTAWAVPPASVMLLYDFQLAHPLPVIAHGSGLARLGGSPETYPGGWVAALQAVTGERPRAPA